ncbi:unnamed protein product [Linum trigynum]|uniref:Uncharacterized protein n=1 Tax=Linum trigynum TaxID=586398 RepID=A0AAV2EJ99_9ROSI
MVRRATAAGSISCHFSCSCAPMLDDAIPEISSECIRMDHLFLRFLPVFRQRSNFQLNPVAEVQDPQQGFIHGVGFNRLQQQQQEFANRTSAPRRNFAFCACIAIKLMNASLRACFENRNHHRFNLVAAVLNVLGLMCL